MLLLVFFLLYICNLQFPVLYFSMYLYQWMAVFQGSLLALAVGINCVDLVIFELKLQNQL